MEFDPFRLISEWGTPKEYSCQNIVQFGYVVSKKCLE